MRKETGAVKILLFALAVTAFFFAVQTWATTLTLRSSGKDASDPGDWTWTGSELGDNSDATYASAAGSGLWLRSDIQRPFIPSDAVINSVVVYVRARQTGNEYIEFGVYCAASGTDSTGSNVPRPGSSFTDYSNSFVTNPCTNSSWTITDIENLVVSIGTIRSGRWWSGEMQVSEVWVVVDYSRSSLQVLQNRAAVDSDVQITVSAFFSDDANGNSSTDFELCYDSGCVSSVPVCSGVTGSSPRSCVFSGLAQNTSYWFRVTHSDPDGVNGSNPQIIGPYRTSNNRVIPDPAEAAVESSTTITVSAPFTGDANGDSSTTVERCTDSSCSSPVTICSDLAGSSPRTCVDNSLSSQTSYWFRITFSDPDGVNTSNASNPQIIGPYTTPAPDTTPPVFGGIALAEDMGRGRRVRLEFDAATDESPPIKYNVYYNLASSWNDADWSQNNVLRDVNTRPGKTYQLKTYLDGLEEGEEYVVGVRAEDARGNEDTNSVTLTVIPYPRMMKSEGYYLVADGLAPASGFNRPSQVFGDDVGGTLLVYTWVSSGLGFNAPFQGRYEVPSVITPGKAYWVYNWQPGNLLDDDYGSRNTSSQTIVDLLPGWNMIANPYHKNVRLRDVVVTKVNNPGAGDYTFEEAVLNGWLVNAVYWWNGSGYNWAAYNDNPPAKLVPWRGYWIYQSDDSVQLQLKFTRP